MQEELYQDLIQPQCEVVQTTVSSVYDIILDEDIREPAYYRQAIQTIKQARPQDQVNIVLNNGGGRIDSAIMFRNAIQACECPVFAILEGDTHSATSMIALSCDDIEVKPFSSAMIHNASYGTAGVSQNVVDHVTFTSKQTERLVREVYKHFLSDEEIDQVINNREIWLTDDQIIERWERVLKARQLEYEELQSEGPEEEAPQVIH